jgi:hypothetical protein
MAAFVIILFTPCLISFLNKKQAMHWVAITLGIGILSLGLSVFHKQYYKKNIAGWEQQEKFRQALFSIYNSPKKSSGIKNAFANSNEAKIFFSSFLYDSVKLTPDRINSIAKKVTRYHLFDEKIDLEGLYWFFIEMRIYILLFLSLALSLALANSSAVKKWLLHLMAIVGAYAFFFVFLKFTLAIHMGLLMILFVQLTIHLNPSAYFLSNNKMIVISQTVAFALLFSWMGVRLYKQNEVNKERRQKFICALSELNRDPQKLFVATFPLGYFYIWNVPAQYPVKNLLYKDRLITHTYLQTLARFKITNLQEAIVNNKNVFILGNPLPAVLSYTDSLKTEGPFQEYHCMEVSQLSRIK